MYSWFWTELTVSEIVDICFVYVYYVPVVNLLSIKYLFLLNGRIMPVLLDENRRKCKKNVKPKVKSFIFSCNGKIVNIGTINI